MLFRDPNNDSAARGLRQAEKGVQFLLQEELQEWLEQLGAPEYAPGFFEQGFDDLSVLQSLRPKVRIYAPPLPRQIVFVCQHHPNIAVRADVSMVCSHHIVRRSLRACAEAWGCRLRITAKYAPLCLMCSVLRNLQLLCWKTLSLRRVR